MSESTFWVRDRQGVRWHVDRTKCVCMWSGLKERSDCSKPTGGKEWSTQEWCHPDQGGLLPHTGPQSTPGS